MKEKESKIPVRMMKELREHGLAPIVLFVYNRPEHTAQTIAALKKNLLARESDLIIYADAAKTDTHEVFVEATREVVRDVSEGFRSVTLIEREKNLGLARSVILGVGEVLSRNGKVIVLEDDLVTAPGFLLYMNQALVYYENKPEVFSVSGYTPPSSTFSIPEEYKEEVYFSYRNSSWGWGTWQDRWDKVDWEVKDYDNFRRSPKLRKKFMRGGGDLPDMLRGYMMGEIDSWAIRFCYAHSKHNAVSVCPVESFVKNIGRDGSGTHFTDNSAKSDEDEITFEVKPTTFPSNIYVHKELTEQFRHQFEYSLKHKVYTRLKEYLYPLHKSLNR